MIYITKALLAIRSVTALLVVLIEFATCCCAVPHGVAHNIGQGGANQSSPNIVVIMGDDWSWPHAGVLGDSVVKTPNFDRIAEEGVLFTNAFVSAPSCTSSRFAIATGQHHWRLGDADSLGGSLAEGVPVYSESLAASGYTTGFCRKGAAPSKHAYRNRDPFGPRVDGFSEFMDRRDSAKPFCFWYGAGEPHRPYDWQASVKGRIDVQKITVPKCLPDNETIRTDLGDYYLRVEKLDRLAGEILAKLESERQLENTIVVMTSDNGMPFPRCKATLYDTGTRVPLAIRWGSRFKRGTVIDDFVSLTDLAPTFLQATGNAIPAEMTGRSLLAKLLPDHSETIVANRDHVLLGRERHVYRRPARAIRTSDFLYIRNFAPESWATGKVKDRLPDYDFSLNSWPTDQAAFSFDVDPSPTKQWMLNHADRGGRGQQLAELAFGVVPAEELYDLKQDSAQLVNVVNDGKYVDVRQKLSLQLTAELRQSGDPRFALPTYATFEVLGWTVNLHDQLWQDEQQKTKTMLSLLAQQLKSVVDVVPRNALLELRKVPIWINPPYEAVRPTAEYHPGAGWLKDNGRNPDMAKCVEITTVANFAFEDRRMTYLMLHELAHAYHDRVLGFDQPDVIAALEVAKDSGGYNAVQRFNGRTTVIDKAYALSNHKEYFAESTEAYFGRNDFFPFDRKELQSHDIQIHNLMPKLWGDQSP